jgi:hypothetical protein
MPKSTRAGQTFFPFFFFTPLAKKRPNNVINKNREPIGFGFFWIKKKTFDTLCFEKRFL